MYGTPDPLVTGPSLMDNRLTKGYPLTSFMVDIVDTATQSKHEYFVNKYCYLANL